MLIRLSSFLVLLSAVGVAQAQTFALFGDAPTRAALTQPRDAGAGTVTLAQSMRNLQRIQRFDPTVADSTLQKWTARISTHHSDSDTLAAILKEMGPHLEAADAAAERPSQGWVLKTREQANAYFRGDGFAAANQLGLGLVGGNGVLFADPLSDNVAIVPGVFGRMSFRTAVANEDTTGSAEAGKSEGESNNALDRFFGVGGNAVLDYALPVAFAISSRGGRDEARMDVTVSARTGASIPALSGQTEVANYYGELGLDLHGGWQSGNGLFRLDTTLRAASVRGTDEFRDQVGLEGSNAFRYVSLAGALVIDRRLAIEVSRPLGYGGGLSSSTPKPLTISLKVLGSGS